MPPFLPAPPVGPSTAPHLREQPSVGPAAEVQQGPHWQHPDVSNAPSGWGDRLLVFTRLICLYTEASSWKGPQVAYNKRHQQWLHKINPEKSETKEKKMPVCSLKGTRVFLWAFWQGGKKKGKHNCWFYQNRNASSQGTKISVGMKCKKEVFPQSFRAGALSNKTDKCSRRCQVADYFTDLQSKLKTEPCLAQSRADSSTRKWTYAIQIYRLPLV